VIVVAGAIAGIMKNRDELKKTIVEIVMITVDVETIVSDIEMIGTVDLDPDQDLGLLEKIQGEEIVVEVEVDQEILCLHYQEK